MGAPVVEGTRCPQCSAALRPGAPWCTQCYAAAPAAGRLAVPPAAAPLPAPRPEPSRQSSTGPSWPCEVCGNPNAITDDACAICGTRFLAAVRQAEPALVLPLVGDLVAMSSVRRAAVAVALAVVLLVVTAALGLLLA